MWLYLIPETCNSFFSYWFPAYLFLFLVYANPFPCLRTMTAAFCLISEILEPNSIILHQRGSHKKQEEGKREQTKTMTKCCCVLGQQTEIWKRLLGVLGYYIQFGRGHRCSANLRRRCVCEGLCAASAMQGNKPKIRQQQNHKTKATNTQTHTHSCDR